MADDESLTGSLIVAARLCRSVRAELLQEVGLHAGQDVLLKSLRDNDGQTMGSLATDLGVRPPTITKMVMRMSAQGYVRRENSKYDSRQNHVFLTEAGSDLLASVEDIWRSAEEVALGKLKEKDTRRLRKILSKITSNLSQQRRS